MIKKSKYINDLKMILEDKINILEDMIIYMTQNNLNMKLLSLAYEH
jgi:hypothetical protein